MHCALSSAWSLLLCVWYLGIACFVMQCCMELVAPVPYLFTQ